MSKLRWFGYLTKEICSRYTISSLYIFFTFSRWLVMMREICMAKFPSNVIFFFSCQIDIIAYKEVPVWWRKKKNWSQVNFVVGVLRVSSYFVLQAWLGWNRRDKDGYNWLMYDEIYLEQKWKVLNLTSDNWGGDESFPAYNYMVIWCFCAAQKPYDISLLVVCQSMVSYDVFVSCTLISDFL